MISILSKPTNSWTEEDLHQLRISLRYLKLFIWIQQKLLVTKDGGKIKNRHSKISSKSNQLYKLKLIIKKLLKSSSRMRDLDVCKLSLKKMNLFDSFINERVDDDRNLEIIKFDKKWPLAERKKINKELAQCTSDYQTKNNTKETDKVIKQITKKLLKSLKNSTPQSKTQWHELRRKLRKANYLLLIQKTPQTQISKLQKTLGIIHDLEFLQKNAKRFKIPKVKFIRKKELKLLKNSKKQFSNLKHS